MERYHMFWLLMNTYISFTSAIHTVANQARVSSPFHTGPFLYSGLITALSSIDCHRPNPSNNISTILKPHLLGFSRYMVSVLTCIPAAKCSCLLNLWPFMFQDPQWVGNIPSSALSAEALVSITGWWSMTWKNILSNKAWMALVTGLQTPQNSAVNMYVTFTEFGSMPSPK